MACVESAEKAADEAWSCAVRGARATQRLVESTLLGSLVSKRRPRSALLIGLDNSGKSSILCSLPQVRERLERFARRHRREELRIEPTTALQLVKFEMTRSSYRRCHRRAMVCWHVWDMSGQGRYRPLWMYYCSLVQAIVFVVDVTDVDRVALARDELRRLFSHPATVGLPLLVLANKMDAAQVDVDEESPKARGLAVGGNALRGMLDLDALETKHRLDVRVAECSAQTGRGIEAAFQWLTDHVVW